MNDEVMTAKEAARFLKICQRTLFTISKPRGNLPCVRFGGEKKPLVRYRKSDLLQWAGELAEGGKS